MISNKLYPFFTNQDLDDEELEETGEETPEEEEETTEPEEEELEEIE